MRETIHSTLFYTIDEAEFQYDSEIFHRVHSATFSRSITNVPVSIAELAEGHTACAGAGDEVCIIRFGAGVGTLAFCNGGGGGGGC